MSDVRVDFKSDSSPVDKNISKIKSGLGSISGLAGTVGTALKASFVTIAAAAGAASAAFIAGSKDVVDLGGELDDLSSKTSISVKDLVVLQNAFELAGLNADQVSKAVLGLNNKLEKPNKELLTVLNDLGLSLEDLNNLTIGEKFTAVSKAIGNVADSSDRAAIAASLFGRNLGQGLLPLFNNKSALKEASVYSSELGEAMQQYAPAFAAIGDAVGAITLKLRLFFTEALGQNADKLLALSDRLLEVDFGGAGSGLGSAIGTLLDLFEGRSLSEGITLALVEGIALATPILIDVFIKGSDILAQGILKGVTGDASWGNVSIAKTLDDVELMFTAIGIALKKGPSEHPFIKGNSSLPEAAARIRGKQIKELEEIPTIRLRRNFEVSLLGMTESMLNATREFMLMEDAVPKLRETIFKNAQDVISNTNAKILKPSEMPALGGAVPLSDLQRVGGAKIFSGVGGPNPMVEEQKKTNKTLMDIYNEQKKTKIPANFLASFA